MTKIKKSELVSFIIIELWKMLALSLLIVKENLYYNPTHRTNVYVALPLETKQYQLETMKYCQNTSPQFLLMYP